MAKEKFPVSPSRPFILRPVATSLLMAAIVIVGVIAYFLLPVSALPEVDYPTIQVVPTFPRPPSPRHWNGSSANCPASTR